MKVYDVSDRKQVYFKYFIRITSILFMLYYILNNNNILFALTIELVETQNLGLIDKINRDLDLKNTFIFKVQQSRKPIKWIIDNVPAL